ncbi:hypothetical protein ALC57_01365 [Trachymyrmex cornetzi]|uniref:Uncharacterized protein n=1 Tax=Trachymyrmex cornetzi TaxID=471704 RepID=A0A195EMW5_9HYME|nr:hypothetical protein ALC57_01365 [Trachymyrmex cornetzi]
MALNYFVCELRRHIRRQTLEHHVDRHQLVGPARPTGEEGTRGTDHREGRHPFLKKGVEAWHQVKSSVTIGCLQSVGSRGSEAEEEGGGVGGSEGGGTSMCCVLQGAERVFPSVGNGGKHGAGVGSGKGAGDTPVGAQDLPLESLWAAGLDEGMGFPQRCSYANQHTSLAASSSTSHTSPANPDELWRERNFPHRTPTTSTGIGSSITDEIWTSANERRFCRTSTTSTGIGSSLNLHENNRSLESRDGDFYSTDIEDSKDTSYRRFYPTTPTTSGLGSSSDRQSVETQCGSRDLPDHLWAAAMEDGFSRFNAMKSLQTITRQPRPNHDWVKTERISRFTKHRTISQSPQHEQEIWTSKLNESAVVSGYATQRNFGPHKCHHQARRSFSTSIVADLAVTPDGSQQSLGSGEFLVSLGVISVLCPVIVV